MHADDNFVRSERPLEANYFHASGNAELTLPTVQAEVEVMRGFEYRFEKKHVMITAGRRSNLTVYLQPLNVPRDARSQCVSGDVHVHMNYRGAYLKTSKNYVDYAEEENILIVAILIVK